MAIGRTFPEALNKAIRGLEIGAAGFGTQLKVAPDADSPALNVPSAQRLLQSRRAAHGRRGGTRCRGNGFRSLVRHPDGRDAGHRAGADPSGPRCRCVAWRHDAACRTIGRQHGSARCPACGWGTAPGTAVSHAAFELLRRAKRHGFSDAQIGEHWAVPAKGAQAVRAIDWRTACGPTTIAWTRARPNSRRSLPISTPHTNEATRLNRPAIGRSSSSAAARIASPGDRVRHLLRHACIALKELGYETIMVNCNPERSAPITTPLIASNFEP